MRESFGSVIGAHYEPRERDPKEITKMGMRSVYTASPRYPVALGEYVNIDVQITRVESQDNLLWSQPYNFTFSNPTFDKPRGISTRKNQFTLYWQLHPDVVEI